MTSQHRADRDLAVWQQNRHLTPRERMAKLLDDCFSRPPVSDEEYNATIRRVSESLAEDFA
jgi:hypothetical protein